METPEFPFPVDIGEIPIAECQMVNQLHRNAETPPQFTRGYGLSFGHGKRRAMAMALADRALRADEYGEERTAPAQQEEFVRLPSNNVEATGFVEHLKLPRYMDFQSELKNLRAIRALREAAE